MCIYNIEIRVRSRLEFPAKVAGHVISRRWRRRRRRRDSIGVAAVYGNVARQWRGRRTKHGVREVIAM